MPIIKPIAQINQVSFEKISIVKFYILNFRKVPFWGFRWLYPFVFTIKISVLPITGSNENKSIKRCLTVSVTNIIVF
jgi:hypothetical protein